ncbi:MAG: endonuclease/exonuclease/phosphatase family protein [Myxococcota bacterium]
MKRFMVVALALVVMLGVSTNAFAGKDRVEVMTMNQYLGADLTPVIAAPDLPSFVAAATAALNQIAANNFPERADALARLINDREPDLVGLQEVFNFSFDPDGAGPIPFINGPPPFTDHLAETLRALNDHADDDSDSDGGEPWQVLAVVQNLDLILPGFPVPGLGVVDLRVTDRDVILGRGAVAASAVPVAFPCAKPSVDGCNYDLIASAASPLGPIDIERGWVGVDATVDGKDVRFVNTHLEVQNPDPTNPFSSLVQDGQARQLIGTLAFTPSSPGRSLIVVGDINSSPVDPVIPGPLPLPPPFDAGIIPPYTSFVGAGYTDAWTLRPGNKPGFTCCQAADLLNVTSIHDERIDMLFSLDPLTKVKAKVLGAKQKDKSTPSNLWPSDHSSVVGRLTFN